MIEVRRVYGNLSQIQGARFLVDRLWPRGIKKEDLRLEAWFKEAAPSNELRHWYNHEPAKWDEFRRRYFRELDAHPDAWKPLLDAAERGEVTLLYSARETERNNATALKEYLEDRLKKRQR